MATLETHGLVKQFRGSVVVDHVDLRVNSGEIVGLLGPNGAGKTTCFYMICGLTRRGDGLVQLDNTDIGDLPMHARARLGIGYLPQEPSIFRRLTVEQNILAVLEALPDLSAEQRLKRSNAMLSEFGIAHKRDAKGYSLSGGERRDIRSGDYGLLCGRDRATVKLCEVDNVAPVLALPQRYHRIAEHGPEAHEVPRRAQHAAERLQEALAHE